MLVEPCGEPAEVGQHDVGPGLLQLLPGAATGEHRDARDAGGPRPLDVVDVVADVDAGVVPAQHLSLAAPPHPPLDDVDVEIEVVDVQLGVRRVLARDQHDPPLVASYGGQGLGHAREGGGRRHGDVGVDLAEPVGRRRDLVDRQVRLEQQVEGRPELRGHLGRRELHPELGAERVQRGRETHHRVDQRHVEIEPDHQLVTHGASVRGRLVELVEATHGVAAASRRLN